MKLRKIGAALAAVAVSGAIAWGANIPFITGPQDVNNLNNYLNTLINSINSLVTPQSMGSANTFRNVLDNGAMSVTQRGTTEVTCALNGAAILSAAYTADRWGCDANVAVGAAFAQVVTSSPTPPVGFQQGVNLYRKTGALTQPACLYQEIPTVTSVALAGQSVVLSVYAAVLAGGPTTPTFNAYIMTGTGTDQGFGSWTASPAITPAWTGIATTGSFSGTATATPTRYTMGAAVLPTATTEIAVALCFTPGAETAGTTDGFYFTGVQLELGTAGTGPSAFEFRNAAVERVAAQRYFYRLSETATTVGRAMCAVSTTSATKCLLNFPVVMFKIPTLTYTAGFASCTTTACTAVSACTSLGTDATSTPASPTGVMLVCGSSAAFAAAGSAGWLSDNSGSGVINANADF